MGKTYECGVSLEKAQLLEPGLDVRLVVGGEGLGRHDFAAVDDAASPHCQDVVHGVFLGDLRALLDFGVSGVGHSLSVKKARQNIMDISPLVMSRSGEKVSALVPMVILLS